MGQLVTGSLDGPILDLPGNFGSEISHWLVFMCKVGMVPSITLNTDSPALLGHSKHKCPPIFRIQVRIGKHKQTLILLQLNISLQIIEDLARVELFHLGIWANPSLYDFLLF